MITQDLQSTICPTDCVLVQTPHLKSELEIYCSVLPRRALTGQLLRAGCSTTEVLSVSCISWQHIHEAFVLS